MKVYVLALDGVFDTGLATVLDAFATANELAEISGLAAPRFEVAIVGVRGSVKTSQGLIVPDAGPSATCSCKTRHDRRGPDASLVGKSRRDDGGSVYRDICLG
jgi:hypothetical protein